MIIAQKYGEMLNIELGLSMHGHFDFNRLKVPEIYAMNHRLGKILEARAKNNG